MTIRIFNSLTLQKEEFRPILPGKVRMFVCGPTVYDSAHIGHARTYIAYDIIARHLKRRGYRVKLIVNITDVDEKVFDRARIEGRDPLELATFYMKEFVWDMKLLNVTAVSRYAGASDHMEEASRQVEELYRRGFAYRGGDRIYFDTSRFPEYGKLSHQTPAELKLRPLELDPVKRSQTDFLLWRLDAGEPPLWKSSFGPGRPGWHIEDTAISFVHLGEQYDLHGGASDLIFPHHDAEIAQAEALTGKRPFVRFWTHTGLLMIDGRKMSKSLGNFLTIRDAVKIAGSDSLRLLLSSTHYGRDVKYTEAGLKQAAKRCERIRNALNLLDRTPVLAGSAVDRSGLTLLKRLERRFLSAMDDDFNTPEAIRSLEDLVARVEDAVKDGHFDKEFRREAIRIFEMMLGTLGFFGR